VMSTPQLMGVTSTTDTLSVRASLRFGELRSRDFYNRYAPPAPRNLKTIP
jgi:hypothetical protein